MNIQFSLSTSVNSQLGSGSISSQFGNISETSRQVVSPINNIQELKRLEQQAGTLSIGQEQLIKRLDQAFKALEGPETTLQVSIHEPTHSIMVKVVNKETGELIREVPPEKTLDLVASMMEIAGILIDKRT
ncbi:flagellar protein FlaG [compost metagenome]